MSQRFWGRLRAEKELGRLDCTTPRLEPATSLDPEIMYVLVDTSTRILVRLTKFCMVTARSDLEIVPSSICISLAKGLILPVYLPCYNERPILK